MSKHVRLTVCAFFIALSAWAQDRVVTGKVTDASGNALPGVNVVVKGTANGTITDGTGMYSISVPDNAIVVFSSIGFTSSEQLVGGRSVIDVSMAEDTKQLSEVVVTGYGTQQKARLSSAITKIEGEALQNLAAASFDTQLSGRIAGVQTIAPSGVLGESPTIRIRGINSLTSGTYPLIVVDNVPIITTDNTFIGDNVKANPLASINPADIESYEVLKDGAATAIYGSRAANGVILITTKRGSKSKGQTNVDFNMSTGINQTLNRFDLLNAEQFVEIANEKLANAGVAKAAFMDSNNTNTNWQDVIFRSGKFNNYSVGLSGATEKTNYFFSIGYQNQEGILRTNDMKRLTFKSTFDTRINKHFEMGGSFSIANTKFTGQNMGENALSGNLSGGARLFPNVSPYDPTNPTGYNLSTDGTVLGRGANTRQIDSNYTNIAFVINNNKFSNRGNNILANVYFKINLTDGLSFKTQYAVNDLNSKDFISYDPRHGDGRGSNGYVYNANPTRTQWNWQNLLNYAHDFGKHSVDILGGVEYQQLTYERFSGWGTNISDRFFLQNGLITGTYVNQFSSGSYEQRGFRSYFGRLNYTYNDKYLFSFSLRNDALSNLPENNRNGTFMGGSIGYRLSEEEFFKNSNISKTLSNAKLRISYAQVGNSDIGAFPYASTYGSSLYGTQNGITFAQSGTLNLKWETSKKLNIGADISLFKNRISLIADYFINDVDGNILDVPYAPSLGVPNNSISQNIGIVRNAGLELSIDASVIKEGKFQWNINANYTNLNNQVKKMVSSDTGQPIPILNNYSITEVGSSMRSIYGYQYAGVNSENGFPMYYKGNGSIVQRNINTGTYSFYNPSSPTSEANTTNASLIPLDIAQGGDRQILGRTQPKWYGGLTNTFTYQAFSLEIFLRFQGGNKVYNLTRQENLTNMDFTNSGTELLNRWTPDNKNTDVPKLYLNRSAQINQTGIATSRFTESGDFLRIQNIVLNYSFPKQLLQKMQLRSLRIFGQLQNAFLFTKYKGLDPELASATYGNGFDYNTNPPIRTFTIGLNVGF